MERNLQEAGPNMQCIIRVSSIIHSRGNHDIAITDICQTLICVGRVTARKLGMKLTAATMCSTYSTAGNSRFARFRVVCSRVNQFLINRRSMRMC